MNRDTRHAAIQGYKALEDLTASILGGSLDFKPTGRAAEVVIEAAEALNKLEGEPSFFLLTQLASRIQGLMDFGVPPIPLITAIAEATQDSPANDAGPKSDWALEVAALIHNNEASTFDEVMERFIATKFAMVYRYDPQAGYIMLPRANELNITIGNLESTIASALYKEFGKNFKTLPLAQVRVLMEQASRKYLASQNPVNEVQELAAKVKLPAPTGPIPKHYTQATGEWRQALDRLDGLFTAYDIQSPREKDAMVKSLVGLCKRSLTPGEVMQWTLHLTGQGGCGKTSYGQILSLKTAPAVILEHHEIGTKGGLEKAIGASVVILDELDEVRGKRATSELKSFISAESHKVRLAYRRDAVVFPATWALVSTANSNNLPDDGTGLRRVAHIPLSGGVPEGVARVAYLQENREHILATAAWLATHGYPCNLTAEDIQEHAPYSQALVEAPEESGLLTGYLPFLGALLTDQAKEGQMAELSTKALHSLVCEYGESWNPRKGPAIEAALTTAGWTKRTSKSRRVYWTPPGLNPANTTPVHPDSLAKYRAQLANR